jgi:peptide/nickel transport system permease protein
MAPILVQFSYALSVALIIEGSLSFLGLGVQPPRPSLGSLLLDGKKYMELAPWMVLFPGVILALAVVSINVFGDWLRDYFDPRLRDSRLQ